jgi:outer membrane receptor protein involved in Fe transport
MLYLDVTGRNDWSSTLPADNWSYFYPSVSLSWIFTESFDIPPGILTFGKIRASYAEVGNDTGPYQINPTFSAGNAVFGVAQYFYARTLPPLNLVPETSKSFEVGFDLKFVNNRIGVDYTYYSVSTINQIMAVDISNASGFNNMRLNAGEINNWGSELMVIFKVLKSTNGLNWDITLNWAKNNNKVEALYGDLEALNISTSWGSVAVQAIPGEAYGVIKGVGYVRTNGEITVGENGLPLKTASPIILGNVVPDWTGGLRNSFRWKTWALSFLFDGRKGGDVYSVTDWFGAYAGVTEETAEGDIRENGFVVDAVYADGSPNSTVVSAEDYYENYWGLPEPSIIDGSFIKFRELTFGYEFPRELISRSGFITGCNISFYGRNLALVWRHKSNDVRIDPETGFGTGNSGMGLEQYQIPPVRELGLRFRFNF